MTKSLLWNRFVKLVEEQHEAITEQFMNDLLKDNDAMAYRNIDRQTVYDSTSRIFRDLSKWITKEFPKEKIEERYMKIGIERFNQGVPPSQVQRALVLQKRHLWLFVMNKLLVDKNEQAYYEAIELNNRVVLYFDRATHYMLRGFEEMINKKL